MSEPTPAEHAATVRKTFGLDDPRGKAADALDALVALAERATELEREIGELHARWQNDVARLGHEVNERQQRADEREHELAIDEQQIMDRIADWKKANDRAERAEAALAVAESELQQWRDSIATETLRWRAEAAEAALRKISAVRLPTGNQMGRDELRGCHRARLEMQQIARAALARREARDE